MRRATLAFILGLGCLALGRSIAGAQPPPPPPPPVPVPSAAASSEPTPAQSATPAASPTPSLPPAGTLPQTVALTITGRPADAEFVQGRIAAALDRAIRPTLRAGATIAYGDPSPAYAPLDPGFQTTYTVPVSIDGGEQAAPVNGQVSVQVVSLNLTPMAPTLLLLDDDPEYIRDNGVLARGTVAPDGNVRLYYYHENLGQPRRFLVLLSAQGAAARVRVIDASAGPNADVMTVGHAASRKFVLLQPRDEGTVLDLAAGQSQALRDMTIGIGEGVAGAVDLRLLGGGPLTATVLAIPPGTDTAAFLSAPKLPNDGHHRHGTFTLQNARETTVAYTVGGPDASLEYGDWAHAPKNVEPGDPGTDGGEYGILQQITFDVANPTENPATVYLYESPEGGPVRNTFSVEGALIEVGCARISERYQIVSYQVAPRSTLAVHVLTMPDGGSNYPLELGMTTTPPQPTTPPITAPNGCFPKPGGPAPLPPASSPVPAPT